MASRREDRSRAALVRPGLSARAALSYRVPVPEIRPAATVVVLRDSDVGPEVFMVRRHLGVAFMAGAHVFPGGRVDPADYEGGPDWCDGVQHAGQQIPGLPPGDSAAFHVAAVRELFEESGVLLARGMDGVFAAAAGDGDRRRFEGHRVEIHEGRRTLREVLAGEGLRVDLESLVYFAHWVTPPLDVRRFDTRFFATRLPPQQFPTHDAAELTEDVWMTPRAALASAARGDIALPPPTWTTLREFEGFASVDAALAWARRHQVRRREPIVVVEDGLRRIFLPGDPRHPEPDPDAAAETRFVLAEGRWRVEPVS